MASGHKSQIWLKIIFEYSQDFRQTAERTERSLLERMLMANASSFLFDILQDFLRIEGVQWNIIYEKMVCSWHPFFCYQME